MLISDVATTSKKPSLKDYLEVTKPKTDRDMVADLESRGWIVTRDKKTERQIRLGGSKKTGRIRIAVVSDTHLGNKHQQLTWWRDFAEKAKKWGAEICLHGGDVVDGTNMHKDQQYELFKHGAAAQGRYAAEVIPKLGETYIIGGNHDGSFFNDAGANVFDTVVARRPDLHYLGAPAAQFVLGNLKIYMMHPDGGVPYARSYKPQKIVEQLAPDNKPHILMLGHWHVPCYLPGYRNVGTMTLPCFESQTPFLKRKGLAPVVGGLLLDVTYSQSGIEKLSPEFIVYKRHLAEDFP